MGRGPAYRIETERLVIRCYEMTDHAAMSACIGASLAHLRAWMTWLDDEPLTDDVRIERLRKFRGMFDGGQDFVYGIFDREGAFLGGTGLHPRVGPDATEIGYWIAQSHEGRGLITEAAGALTRVAIEVHGLDRVEIHCDPRNVRSAAVPERLGYTHEATLRRRMRDSDGRLRDSMIWTIFADELASSPAKTIAYTAYDAAGRAL
ncbi:MAG: GNAT family N-acetyltransferase [Myxococcota bacterium]|nr:GNAT family N-acetyltransferase [Myxococcota bacterium]